MSLIEKAHAYTWNNLINPTQGSGAVSISTILTRVVNFILLIAGGLAVIYLIYSGILYITAAGNPDAAKKGQQGVINAIIGIVIIMLAFFLVRAATTLGSNVNTGVIN